MIWQQEIACESISTFMYIYSSNRIDNKGIIKVADFGLSEDIYARNYFRQFKDSGSSSPVKLPVKLSTSVPLVPTPAAPE